MSLHARRFDTPLGPMAAAVDGRGRLVRLDFVRRDGPCPVERHAARAGAALRWEEAGRCDEAVAQLGAFFRGERRGFDLPLAPQGTAFQRRVWDELRRIPFGRTLTYGELAARLGSPGASRAVGRANATNPVAVVVPCHRVIGADGSLTGYAGGIERKRALLALEAAACRDPAAHRPSPDAAVPRTDGAARDAQWQAIALQ